MIFLEEVACIASKRLRRRDQRTLEHGGIDSKLSFPLSFLKFSLPLYSTGDGCRSEVVFSLLKAEKKRPPHEGAQQGWEGRQLLFLFPVTSSLLLSSADDGC